MPYFRMRWFLFMLPLLVLVAACGSATGSSSIPPTSEALPTMVDDPAAAAPEAGFGTLPQSRTPEGNHVLGDPDAPLVIEFYSDFL